MAPRPQDLSRPSGALQARLAWPTGNPRKKAHDARIVAWMSLVRETVLSQRFDRPPEGQPQG